MVGLIVEGPFVIATKKATSGGLFVDVSKLADLKAQCDGFDRIGCYVFGIRAAKGAKPIYVGKTANQTIFKEAFNARNLNLINQYINARKRGTLLVYLVSTPRGRGRPAKNAVKEVEDFLIGKCAIRNPDGLINIHKTKQPQWSIAGVAYGGQGKPTQTATQFKKLIGIRVASHV